MDTHDTSRFRDTSHLTTHDPGFVPPFCPRPTCAHHGDPAGWRWKPFGAFRRKAHPQVIRRFRCLDCRRCFSTQTFDTTYWLKRPDLQRLIFLRLVECGAHRQIARGLGVVQSTVQKQAERLGRLALLFQEQRVPSRLPAEDLVLDGLQTFEYSQYWPCDFNLLIGADSHYLHGFMDAELRRSGRMTERQKAKRKRLEEAFGRPEGCATQSAVEELLAMRIPEGAHVTLRSDEHGAYPRAIRRLRNRTIDHRRTSSKQARTPLNPLFAVNVADMFIRHSSSNHKRETIAFSKRRQAAAERLAVFQVWRNFVKAASERDPKGPSPAQRAGIAERRLGLADIFHRRLFPTLIELPERLRQYYWRLVPTRQIPAGRRHELRYAF